MKPLEIGETAPEQKPNSNFIVKIDDTYCEWEFGFSLSNEICINDLVQAIEAVLKTKRDYQKMTRGWNSKEREFKSRHLTYSFFFIATLRYKV